MATPVNTSQVALEMMRGAFSPNANLAQSTCQSFEAAGKFCQQYFMQYLTQQRTFEVALIIMIMVMIWWQIYFIKQKPLIAANAELYMRLKKMGVVPCIASLNRQISYPID